jgi:hypothetical protein
MTERKVPDTIYVSKDRQWAEGRTPICTEAFQRAGWRPIESAPKDGTRVLLWDGRRQHVDWWNHGWWNTSRPTHWQPLPPPPEPDHAET